MGFPAARITDPTVHGGIIMTGFPTVLIGSKPAARITDMHTCPMVNLLVPHVGGPIITGAWNVLTGMMPQSRVTDKLICVGPPDVIIMGEPTVLVGTAGGGGAGLGALLGALASAIMAILSPPYPRAVILSDGTVATQFSEGIVIKGDAEFQQRTVEALDKIGETPSGRAMLDDFSETGKTVTIVPTTGGNGVKGFTNDAMRNADGTLGSGSDSTLEYNPDNPSIGSEPWQTRPPEVGLAHEMVHATHVARGDVSTTQVENDSKPDPANPGSNATEIEEEVRTAGIPPYDNEPYSENTIRNEWDPPQPQRPYY